MTATTTGTESVVNISWQVVLSGKGSSIEGELVKLLTQLKAQRSMGSQHARVDSAIMEAWKKILMDGASLIPILTPVSH